MRDDERTAFGEVVQRVGAYYDRRLTPEVIGIYWQGLSVLSLDAVRAALNRHVQDPQAGQYMPKIADIRRQVEAAKPDDGHPGADEAWSIAIRAQHEGATLVWTESMCDAFFVAAQPLLDAGDKIAARRAFIDRYESVVAEARRTGQRARWQVTLGHDVAGREAPLVQAVQLGRLGREAAAKLIPQREIAEPVAAALVAPMQAMRLAGA